MHTQADKKEENKSHAVANGSSQKQSSGESTFQFVDKRTVAVVQRKLQEMGNKSSQARQTAQLQRKSAPVQRIVLNVQKEPLDKLDALIYSAIYLALEAGGYNQAINDVDKAEFNKILPDENVYFVGHGQVDKIGDKDPAYLAKMLRDVKTGLPENYTGKLQSFSCYSGQAEGFPPISPIGRMADLLASSASEKLRGLTLRGARGPAIHPMKGSSRVVKPESYADAISIQQGLKLEDGSTFQSAIENFNEFKKKEPNHAIRAKEAAKLIGPLVDAMLEIEELKALLLPEDEGFEVKKTREKEKE